MARPKNKTLGPPLVDDEGILTPIGETLAARFSTLLDKGKRQEAQAVVRASKGYAESAAFVDFLNDVAKDKSLLRYSAR